MPKRKYTKKRKTMKKKSYKKRKRRTLPLGGFKDSNLVRLKYADLIKIDTTAAASSIPTEYVFRANSCFDPDYTGTGHQPRGWDEQANIYNHYCVLGAKITVHFDNGVNSFQNAGQYCYIQLRDRPPPVPATNTLVDILEEQPRYGSTLYKPFTSAGNSNPNTANKLMKTFSARKFFGIPQKDSVKTNDNLQATVDDNPSEGAYFVIGIVSSSTSTTNPDPIIARVEIEYIVKMTEKNPMTLS